VGFVALLHDRPVQIETHPLILPNSGGFSERTPAVRLTPISHVIGQVPSLVQTRLWANCWQYGNYALRYLSSYASTAGSLWTGRFACCQASKPPITLATFWKPARCSKLHAIMLR